MLLTVTFDTNTLGSVVTPETAQRGTGPSGAAVRTAIQAQRVQGFFSETLLTLEGLQNHERAEWLGKTRVVSKTESVEDRITIAVGVQHSRPSLNRQFAARVDAAVALGIRPLRTAARIGGFHFEQGKYPLFEPPGGILELVRCMDKVNELTTEIARRGVGQAIAVDLGLSLSARDGTTTPELFQQGLGRASTNSERRRVAKAIREWADGDSVAAHYGFGIDLFCTDDCGRNSAGPSVLDPQNKKWLSDNFGIEFVTLPELANRVSH